MRKYLVEFIGTFFLVFTVTCAVLSGAPLAPLGIGAVLMVMVFAGGHISGGHFNPAVTLAVLLRGRITSAEAAPYWGTRSSPVSSPPLLGEYVIDPPDQARATELTGGHLVVAALLAELLFTFALAWVVLNVATSKDHPNNSFYGLAIGFTVLAGAVAVGGVSGGAFNPAVALGIMTAGISAWKNIWIFWLAELAGAALAAYTFKAANPDDA